MSFQIFGGQSGAASNNGAYPKERVNLTVSTSRATSRILGKRGIHILEGYIDSGGRVRGLGGLEIDRCQMSRAMACNTN